ncbi:MAG: AAA family ATPase [Clostridiales bacterium GWB2_37_7]|nr:MAG: AAA family ATPase [Clostridiales bacterium GWB2_37_7]
MTEQGGQNPVGSIENGTYELIKSRLDRLGCDLKDKLDKLNSSRRGVFGSIETTLLGSEKIITENNCVPRDMAPVGALFIFGYNVYMGLKTSVELSDVFSIYEYKDGSFHKQSLELICNDQFMNDFKELYKYYKNTFFAKFTIIGPYLYMVFQTGKSPFDIKAFKWLMKDGKLSYVDNRSDHEVRLKEQSELDWARVKREDHREGRHPHISIKDRVFVETLGGDLTIKVENNTDTGKGIYSEPVEDMDQTLDDAEIYYALVGNLIILKILPYREKEYRYIIFNEKLQMVVRIDAIKDSCVLLPDNHGLIFPKGYYLQSGEYKLFDVPCEGFVFEQRIEAPNGEDFQYIFYNMETGIYLIYTYNIIEQSLEIPIICGGYSHFKNGEMVIFKGEDEPRKNHTIQIWQTPYVGESYTVENKSDSILYKIGNKEIVHCMADCKVVYNLIQKGESYTSIYLDIVKDTERIMDSYYWLDKVEVFNLKAVLSSIKEAATSAVAEFEKVTRIRRSTEKQIKEVDEKAQVLLKNAEYGTFDSIEGYVQILADLRSLRGEIASLKTLRYTNLALVESLEEKVKEKNEKLTQRCTEFLLVPEGLKPYAERVDSQQSQIPCITKTSAGKELENEMAKSSQDLELLIDIVSNFKIEDPTKTTEIIENISAIYSLLNLAKAKLKNRMAELSEKEGIAQFQSQMKLLDQAAANYLDIADSTEKCDSYLNKIMVQIEELEGKFADFEEFIVKFNEKREELYNAFVAKKQLVLEKRNKKLTALFNTSERILTGITSRLQGFHTINEINGYLASDLMIEKVRDIIDQLKVLGDSVKADEIEGRLKIIKEEAVRQLKDRQELFVHGKDVIKFGRHYFSYNTQQLELSMVQKDGELYFHISGTDFWEKVMSDTLAKFRYLWDQDVLSESKEIYRAEYLVYKIFEAALNKDIVTLDTLYSYTEDQLLEFIRKFMEPRYQEGYTKGVHDADCYRILKVLLDLHMNIDLLTYSPSSRAIAKLYWYCIVGSEMKDKFCRRLKELAKISVYFKTEPGLKDYISTIAAEMNQAFSNYIFIDKSFVSEASEYLCKELMRDGSFVASLEADEAKSKFMQHMKANKAQDIFAESLKAFEEDLEGAYYLVREWLKAFFKETSLNEGFDVMDEVVIMLIVDKCDGGGSPKVINRKTKVIIKELTGSHPSFKGGAYTLSYTEFMKKLKEYDRTVVRDFIEFQTLKKDLSQRFRDEIRLEEFKPDVLSSFVRNRLIDKVYLPLIGDNLAKQIGTTGEDKRTDLMGMLLLISPPGYGKTTLVEYIANRLGIFLVKVNGPAIGNDVTSLDPAMAKNAGAREELRKLNLAFKMGNNVMIYIDDIQHCSPEFLQKFIPLCDGQRKIEGVYNGVGQTYDLRGKKLAVVMAGNPYTESGEKFQIPDMLANRADVYNLGDMLRENENAFKLSYIENCLTSNPILNKLTTRSQKDIYIMIDIAQNGEREGVDFESQYSVEEINEFVAVIQKLILVRDVVLDINMEYIYSAAQADEYRKEPPFKLQGSYRNMNKIAERIVPLMDETELMQLVENSYENDSQTLTKGAEANMLKWKEIVGRLNEQDAARWKEIKDIFLKNKLMKGEDKIGQAILKLGDLNEKLVVMTDVLTKGVEKM